MNASPEKRSLILTRFLLFSFFPLFPAEDMEKKRLFHTFRRPLPREFPQSASRAGFSPDRTVFFKDRKRRDFALSAASIVAEHLIRPFGPPSGAFRPGLKGKACALGPKGRESGREETWRRSADGPRARTCDAGQRACFPGAAAPLKGKAELVSADLTSDRTLPATSKVATLHRRDCSLSVELSTNDISATGGHLCFVHRRLSKIRPAGVEGPPRTPPDADVA